MTDQDNGAHIYSENSEETPEKKWLKIRSTQEILDLRLEKIESLTDQLKHRDSEISELKDTIAKKEVAFNLITGQQYQEIQQLKDFLKNMVDNSNFPGCNYTIPSGWRNEMIRIISSHRVKES